MKKILTSCLCIITLGCTAQSWTRITSLPEATFIALEEEGSMMYAATDSNTVYISADQGDSWKLSSFGTSSVHITCLTLTGHVLYAGTNNTGIYMSADSGHTWVHTNPDLFTVSSFAAWRNNLYASTLGGGLYIFHAANNTWQPFNDSIPDYSANVFKVINANDTLIAAAGSNGTFYRYDPVNGWVEEYYLSVLKPSLQIYDMVYSGGSILAVRNGPAILRSDNNGEAWYADTAGLVRGPATDGHLGIGDSYFYAAVNFLVTGGSWIQEKAMNANEAWTIAGDFIPTGYTYAVKESGTRLFLCRSNGLFYRHLATAVTDLNSDEHMLSVYPNPSNGNPVQVESNKDLIRDIAVFNLQGACVFKAAVQGKKIQLPVLPKGMYIVRTWMSNQVRSCKLIVE